MSGFNLQSILPGRHLATATKKTFSFSFPLLSKRSLRVQNLETNQPVIYEKGLPVIGCLPEFVKSPIKFFSRLTRDYDELIEFNFAGMNVVLICDGDLAHQILVKEIQNFRISENQIVML